MPDAGDALRERRAVPELDKLPILVVDDEPAVRDVIARALSAKGYIVAAASSGEEALRLLAHGLEHDGRKAPAAPPAAPCALVLSDLKMPGMGGMELLRRVSRERPGTAMALVTAYGDIESAREAISLGVGAYVLKPVNIGELLSVVERLLAGVKARRERDLFQRELMERYDALRRSEAARDSLVRMVTEELRVPLGTARTNLEFLAEELSSSLTEPQRALLADAFAACDEAFGLSEELLAGRMLAEGSLDVELSPVPLGDCIERARSEIQRSLPGFEASVEGGSEAAVVLAEPRLLGWVLKRIIRLGAGGGSRAVVRISHDAGSGSVAVTVEGSVRPREEPAEGGEGAEFLKLAAEAFGGSLTEESGVWTLELRSGDAASPGGKP